MTLALRSQMFQYLRERFYKRALEYLRSARSEKKMKLYILYVFFLGKHLTIIDPFEGHYRQL